MKDERRSAATCCVNRIATETRRGPGGIYSRQLNYSSVHASDNSPNTQVPTGLLADRARSAINIDLRERSVDGSDMESAV